MSTKQKPFVEQFPLDHIIIDGIEISYLPTQSSLEERLAKEEIEIFSQLLEEVQIAPKKAFDKVLVFKEKHANIPEVDNLLAYLYLQKKDVSNAEKLIEEAYIKYPDYFFAKLNFADQCLRKKQWEKIEKIFPGLDLKTLYPERNSFHVSEFRGFMVLMSYYYLGLGQKGKALEHYQKAYQADPAHISVIVLEKKLFKNSFLKKLKKSLQKLARIYKIS